MQISCNTTTSRNSRQDCCLRPLPGKLLAPASAVAWNIFRSCECVSHSKRMQTLYRKNIRRYEYKCAIHSKRMQRSILFDAWDLQLSSVSSFSKDT